MEPFAILSPYGILIYTIYQYGILANEILRHLKDRHPQFTATER